MSAFNKNNSTGTGIMNILATGRRNIPFAIHYITNIKFGGCRWVVQMPSCRVFSTKNFVDGGSVACIGLLLYVGNLHALCYNCSSDTGFLQPFTPGYPASHSSSSSMSNYTSIQQIPTGIRVRARNIIVLGASVSGLSRVHYISRFILLPSRQRMVQSIMFD